MDAYPLNLILAIATATASILIGFLPTKSVASAFFTKETGKFLVAWVLVGLTSQQKILHYPLFTAFLCFAAWWQFRRDNTFSGKMWLSAASGLGISVNVMLILAVTPYACPPGLSLWSEPLLLTSIYLGSIILGLAYVCLILGLNPKAGITNGLLQHYIGLLPILVIARAAVVVIEFFLPASPWNDRIFGLNGYSNGGISLHAYGSTLHLGQILLVPMLILVALAIFAQRAAGFSSRVQPTRFLMALIAIGFLTEILARLIVL